MILRSTFLFVFLVLASRMVFGGGSAESASTASRGDYLAEQGRLIPSSEVYIDSYLAQIDYNYPDSGDPVTVHLFPSRRTLSTSGQSFWLQVGLQGRRIPFDDLDPLYLVLVVDTSGSMSAANKLDWIKQSISVLLTKLRAQDSLAVLTFADTSRVLVSKEKLASPSSRERVKRSVDELAAFGQSNAAAAIDLAFRTTEATAERGEVRRILFLSDGQGLNAGVIEAAKRQFERSRIPLTTVGYGESFNLADMTELARACSGSSRFISNREKMEEEFSSELDRMVVSIARNVDLSLQVSEPLRVRETWGYENRIGPNLVQFHLPSVHLRDYETMLIRLDLPSTGRPARSLPVVVTARYEDLEGVVKSSAARTELVVSTPSAPFLFPSQPNTAQAVVMLEIAEALQKIGRLDEAAKEWTRLRPQRYLPYRTLTRIYELGRYDTVVDALKEAEPDELTTAVRYLYRDAMDTTIEARRRIELLNIVLGNDLFTSERKILEKYIGILRSPATYREPGAYAWSADPVLSTDLPNVDSRRILSAMLDELAQWLPASSAAHIRPAFTKLGKGETLSGGKQRLDATLVSVLATEANGPFVADAPRAEEETTKIDLTAELAALDGSQHYVVRAYVLELYGATHVVLRLLDSRGKRLIAFTASAVGPE